MGCDIHCFREIKINDRWEHAGELELGRNYDLFGVMVDGHARCYGMDGVSVAKGLPKDINPLTQAILEKVSEHTFSWLDYNECVQVNLHKEFKDNPPIDLNTDGWGFYCLPFTQENFRIVFGFDS